MYICPRVTNCPLFYSDEEEIEEIPPPAEPDVVEVAPPLTDAGEREEGSILPGSK